MLNGSQNPTNGTLNLIETPAIKVYLRPMLPRGRVDLLNIGRHRRLDRLCRNQTFRDIL